MVEMEGGGGEGEGDQQQRINKSSSKNSVILEQF